MNGHHHAHEAPDHIRAFILTVSDTRTVETDSSGRLIRSLLQEGGHHVVDHEIVRDDFGAIQEAVRREIEDPRTQVIILTGGTGISPRDVTFEAIRGLLEKELPGYGELFRMLSYAEIGAATILSRAIAGIAKSTLVIATPGSSNAVRLAMEKIILPEVGHLLREATKGVPIIPPMPREG